MMRGYWMAITIAGMLGGISLAAFGLWMLEFAIPTIDPDSARGPLSQAWAALVVGALLTLAGALGLGALVRRIGTERREDAARREH